MDAKIVRLPELVAAVDWSVRPAKRRVAMAQLRKNRDSYLVRLLPHRVDDPLQLISTLRDQAGPQGVALLGFDFPIGLPRSYALRTGISNFREALARFGTPPDWARFFEPTDSPHLYQPFAPVSNREGGLRRTELAAALGLASEAELFRGCDRKTPTRQRGECLFYLRFAQQVGRSVMEGWRDILVPHRDSLRIWPFDGELRDLLPTPGIVVAEVYPAEAISHLGLPLGPGSGKSKRRQEDRATAGRVLVDRAAQARVALVEKVRSALESGCDSEDAFDALVALVSMVYVLHGLRPADPPVDQAVRQIEGWILGQGHGSDDGTRPTQRLTLKTQPEQPRQDRYFIRRVSFLSSDTHGAIELAYPTEAKRGVVNVVCGPNNAGKSFLLNQIARVVTGKSHRWVLGVEPLPKGQPRVLFLGRAWEAKDKIGLVSLYETARALSVPRPEGDYRRVGLSFLLSQMASHIPGLSREHLLARAGESAVRDQIARAFEVEQQIYRCDGADALVQRLEGILGGRLYFRCTQRKPDGGTWLFEFVLAHEDGTLVPYQDWSDGQRACFYVLASIEYFRPEVILFDELENHLHPALISEVLEALRAYPIQSIIATHHPHIIFSRFVDRVFYLESERPRQHARPPVRLPYSSARAWYERRIHRLEDDFERITAAYKLFAHQDDQLLRQAGYVQTRAILALAEALRSLTSHTAVTEKPGPLPDTQTQQLADRIRAFARLGLPRPLRILDLGAGIGRQIAELHKMSEWQLGAQVQWTCFEPLEANRRRLSERFGSAQDVAIAGEVRQIPRRRFDFCVLANVLHELTPPEFARYVALADAHADHVHGGVLALELFPLLRPEGHAVPYEPATLVDILSRSGFNVDMVQVPVGRGVATAYCVLARRRSAPARLPRIRHEVERAWTETLLRSLSAYELRQTPADVTSYQALLSHLTTIASITSWRARKWHPAWPRGRRTGRTPR